MVQQVFYDQPATKYWIFLLLAFSHCQTQSLLGLQINRGKFELPIVTFFSSRKMNDMWFHEEKFILANI